MSWDVIVLRFSRPYAAVDEIPEKEETLALGPREVVHRAVSHVFPGTDWSDPSWGMWDSDFGSIEFNLGRDDPAESLMLHVRASAEVVPAIMELCGKNGWQAIDCSMGEFLEASEDPAEGLNAWRAYRDRVIGDTGPEDQTDRIHIEESLPAPLRDAAVGYATGADEDEVGARLFEAFGIAEVGDEAHRRAVWLCVLAVRKVIHGWADCTGDEPAETIEAVARWARSDVEPSDWTRLCTEATAIRDGEVIRDCDACRVEPIATAAARSARFAHQAVPADAYEVLSSVWEAINQGVEWKGAMRFEHWVVTIALPAALELRDLSDHELRA